MKAPDGDTDMPTGWQVIQWVGFEFHSWSPLWKQHPDWVLKQANDDPWHGKYAWAKAPSGAVACRSGSETTSTSV